jgi:hypothetical protein
MAAQGEETSRGVREALGKRRQDSCTKGPRMTERLRFDNLDQHLLLKNGNYLYKVPFRGGWAVLKVYYGSRSGLSHAIKTLENFLANQTSYMPRARLRTELGCLALWRQIGVRVFDTYDDVVVEGLPEGSSAG